MGNDPSLDLGQLGFVDLVHGVPKAPVVEGRRRQLYNPVAGRLGPPVGKSPLGAGVYDPIGRRQGHVGPHRARCIGPTRADDLVDDLSDL